MARHDRRHLEQHGNQWRVRIKVPNDARPILKKTFLVEGLRTDSLALANARKWEVIARLKGLIEDAKQRASGTHLTNVEALEWRERLQHDEPEEGLMDSLLVDRAVEIEERHGFKTAKAFVDVARGKATLIEPLVETWLAEAQYAGRTAAAYRQGVAKFIAWAKDARFSIIVEEVDRKVAGRYVQEVFVKPGADPATANKLISGLSALWTWAIKRGFAEVNPWTGQGLRGKKVRAADGGGATRPFTDEEATAILKVASGTLRDMCVVAALSGMRLSEIATLTVRDVHLAKDEKSAAADHMRVVEGKTDAASRAVPIHPALRALLASRCAGKAAGAYVFHELTEQVSQARTRGTAMSQAFSRLLHDNELEDRIPGRRQARTGFHSWRRWFIRKAVEALEQGATGFTAWTLAEVVGHSKESGPLPMTMGRYPGAAGMEAKRACVEAVVLPVKG
ncbi:DUF6538 domain-containing protein [Xanthobacter autotrophicus]|uniref:DUF6538 domain-containing protein n=1 Tax=Xanthobacter autotrophicus TaxID=280 RepID=UPI00372BC407